MGPEPVTPQSFLAPPNTPVNSGGAGARTSDLYPPGAPVPTNDQPGALPVKGTPQRVEPNVAPSDSESSEISPVVEQVIRPADEGAATRPSTTGPTTRSIFASSRPGEPSGEYLTLGTVLTSVNGTPIYANKVLRLQEGILRSRARELDTQRFALAARDVILEGTRELIFDELEYAASERSLDTDDKRLAEALAERFRARKITDSGGSIELARRKAAADGEDFDEMVRNMYRQYMTILRYQRKFLPLVEVTGQDMRRFYRENAQKLFAVQKGEAQFKLIEIDPQKLDARDPAHGRQMALERAKMVHDKAVAGEDFDALARQYSDYPGADKAGGNVGGPYQRGAFALEDVEAAVWKLQPGQVTDVIENGRAFFIAKVERLTPEEVQPFDSDTVQDKIRNTLRSQQLNALRLQERQRLFDDAIVSPNPPNISPAVDMAVQNYSEWRK